MGSSCFKQMLDKIPENFNIEDCIIIHNVDYDENKYKKVDCKKIVAIKKGLAYLISKELFDSIY